MTPSSLVGFSSAGTPAAKVALRRLKPILLGALLGLVPVLGFATEVVPGLAYLRPGQPAPPTKGSAILDLRSLAEDSAAAPLLSALEPGETNSRRVVLVLISDKTPAGLRNQLAGRPRWLTVGRAASDLRPDLVVAMTVDAEQRALAALASGTPPEQLVVENADKPRFDETSLIREHSGESTVPASLPEAVTKDATSSTALPESEADKSHAASPAAKPPAPPVDSILQRAVQVYRGLVALKRID